MQFLHCLEAAEFLAKVKRDTDLLMFYLILHFLQRNRYLFALMRAVG